MHGTRVQTNVLAFTKGVFVIAVCGRTAYVGEMSRLHVRVTPRAARDLIGVIDPDGVLHVRVTAAPAEGAANAAVSRLLAGVFDVPPRDVVLVSGASARQKVFDLPLSPEAIEACLRGHS